MYSSKHKVLTSVRINSQICQALDEISSNLGIPRSNVLRLILSDFFSGNHNEKVLKILENNVRNGKPVQQS